MATRRFGARPTEALDNMAGGAAPAATDCSGDGYAVGSVWVDLVADKVYICVDSTADNAVWNETTGSAITPSAEVWGSGITNEAADRTLDANATTIDELCDVLGTLINDLVATGIILAA